MGVLDLRAAFYSFRYLHIIFVVFVYIAQTSELPRPIRQSPSQFCFSESISVATIIFLFFPQNMAAAGAGVSPRVSGSSVSPSPAQRLRIR